MAPGEIDETAAAKPLSLGNQILVACAQRCERVSHQDPGGGATAT
jgi:hypothetical protein